MMTTSFVGKHAVVVGAGIGGLTAAGALAGHFERVTVLERDNLPGDAAHRSGTPQANHVHAMLAGGLRALAELFPQFDDDLARAGAVRMRGGLDIRMERPGFDLFPKRDLGMFTYAASRPAIEFALRQRVLQLPNVRMREHCRVLELVTAAHDNAVIGVRFDNPDTGNRETLLADLVVDASGRGNLTLDALRAMGHPLPEEDTVGIDLGYASATFEIPDAALPDWKGVITFPNAPQSSRGAVLLPLEGRRWRVSTGGRYDDKPPGDEAGFLAYLRELPTTTIHDAVCNARRVGEIVRYAFAQSVRRHFERLPTFPRGLLPIADAICAFNPLYGQGMSVAAQEASLLHRLLQAAPAHDPLGGLAPAFFAKAEQLLDTPWAMSTTPDFVFPQTTGRRPPDLERTLKFGGALTRLAIRKADVHKLLVEVQHLLKPRSAYRAPLLMARVMLEMVRSRIS